MSMLTAISPQTTQTLPAQSERFHALDAVRAFALILGIFLHGAMSFADTIPVAKWPIKDVSTGLLPSLFFYVVHVFRMQTFFLIAGFFAHLLYQHRGPDGFLINRAKRILLPFLVFLPLIFLANVWLFLWGWFCTNLPAYQGIWILAELGKASSWLSWLDNGFPLLHLWFLYYLSWFCGVAWLSTKLPATRLMVTLDKGLAVVMNSWWGSLVLAMLLVLPMQTAQDIAFGGIETPYFNLFPHVDAFLNYGFYFTIGWLLHRQEQLMACFRSFRWPNTALSVVFVAIVASSFLIGFYTKKTLLSDGVYRALYAMASTTTVFAFIGHIMAYFSSTSQRIRYLSDSAYWLYVIHWPLVVIFQILVAPLQIHWLLKLPLIFVPSFAILFLTYHYGVRNTWLGTLLNGRRYPIK